MIRTDKGHFWLTFNNGYTLSVFNGFGSYSENHFNDKYILFPTNDKEVSKYIFQQDESHDCEIAIISPEGNMITEEVLKCGDSVKGFVDINELVEIINIVNKLGGAKNDD